MASISYKSRREKLEAKVRTLKRQRAILLAPYALLAFPIVLPLYLWKEYKKRKQHLAVASSGQTAPAPKKPKLKTNKSDFFKIAPDSSKGTKKPHVLIWCPIAVAGLTTQLVQLTQILRQHKIKYLISYHVSPTIDHPEKKYWIDPEQISNPAMVFHFERFHPFNSGFETAYHVYYINLDWLKSETLGIAKLYAHTVIAPVPYRYDEIKSTFSNSQVFQLPWPAASRIREPDMNVTNKIRVLYVGNDYDSRSRKSPHAVVQAILSLKRHDLSITLKFRKAIPSNIKASLLGHDCVEAVIDEPTPFSVVEQLYENTDVNLIPNGSEGNGLSIIESWAKGVVPAVLDGHPMKDVVDSTTGYFIRCKQIGFKERAPHYETNKKFISEFFNQLNIDSVAAKKQAIAEAQSRLVERQLGLENLVEHLLIGVGLVNNPVEKESGKITKIRDTLKNEPKAERDSVGIKLLQGQISSLQIRKPCTLVDIYLTTSGRPHFLRTVLTKIKSAVTHSPYRHRLIVMVDFIDAETADVMREFEKDIFFFGASTERLGLPFSWNSLLDVGQNIIARTEEKPDFICYLQDDCEIVSPSDYFYELVSLAERSDPSRVGFVSGYHCEVHAGFEEFQYKGRRIIASDSIDGKNFMCRPELFAGIGKLTWWFPDGSRRGNPGPDRGSHFDLWQWRESPNATLHQGKVNLIIDGLCRHLAEKATDSTWNNDTTREAIERRKLEGRIYRREIS